MRQRTLDYLALFLAAAVTALPVAVEAAFMLASATSDNCLAIEVMLSKALVEAFSIDCMVAAKTSPPTGAEPLAFSTALAAFLVKLLYWLSMTEVTSFCMLVTRSYTLRE